MLAIGGSVIWAADRFPFMLRDVRFQARVAQNLDVAIAEAGGRDALLRCGNPFTNKYLVQLVAWKLHVHGEQVLLQPEGRSVMLRARHALLARAEPPADALAGDPSRKLAARTVALEDRDGVRRVTTLESTMTSTAARFGVLAPLSAARGRSAVQRGRSGDRGGRRADGVLPAAAHAGAPRRLLDRRGAFGGHRVARA